MKYIITESKLERFIFRYLDETLPVITNYGKAFIFTDDNEDNNNIQLFVDTDDNEIGIDSNLYKFFEDMFSLSYDELGKIVKEWVKSKIGFNIGRFRYATKISIDDKFYKQHYKRI